MTSALAKTFDFLARTPNEASFGVLDQAVDSCDPMVRDLSIQALGQRDHEAGFRRLISLWPDFTDDQRMLVASAGPTFRQFIADMLLDSRHASWSTCAQIAETLSIYEAMHSLISKAESANDPAIQKQAIGVVLQLAEQLGKSARQSMDRAQVRTRVLERLSDSVKRFHFHRTEELVDAYLSAASWADTSLQATLAEGGKQSQLLLDRFSRSKSEAVADLLAGWISKRRMADGLIPILRRRDDDCFVNKILHHISETPTAVTLRNLRRLGMLDGFKQFESGFGNTHPSQRPAVLQALSCWGVPQSKLFARALDLIEQGREESIKSACVVMRRLPPLNPDDLLRESIVVAEIFQSDPHSPKLKPLILWRQIKLLGHAEEQVRATLRSSLDVLTVARLFEYGHTLSIENLRKVGTLISKVDLNGRAQIHDALRHPVLQQRMKGFRAIIAIDLVDSMLKTLRDLLDREHLEAKIQIVEVLRWGSSEESLELLKNLAKSASGPVRDAAIKSINQRLKTA